MKKHLVLIMMIVCAIFFGSVLSAAAGEIEEAIPGRGFGLGKAETGLFTLFGDFKKCSRDAYIYVIVANKYKRDINVTIPHYVYADDNCFTLKNGSYMYKELNPEIWTGAQFADARSGEPLNVDQSNSFVLPSGKVWAIMGKIENISHHIAVSDQYSVIKDTLNADATFLFDGVPLKAHGEIGQEGNLCDVIKPVPFEGYNEVKGGYKIDPSGKKVCSMAYYIKIANPDPRYSITIELPKWIYLDGVQRFIGCEFLDDTCTVSGFRHYAWAEAEADGVIRDQNFTFCDKDTAKGDICYEEGDLWWLTIPAGKTILLRSMVNNLCSVKNDLTNPLTEEYVDIDFILNDIGNHPHPVKGQIFGTSGSGKSVGSSYSSEHERSLMTFYPLN